jgi:hypothetical protein
MREKRDIDELIASYLGQAELCRDEASRTTLPNELERLKRAEESWLALAEAQRNIQAGRERRLLRK